MRNALTHPCQLRSRIGEKKPGTRKICVQKSSSLYQVEAMPFAAGLGQCRCVSDELRARTVGRLIPDFTGVAASPLSHMMVRLLVRLRFQSSVTRLLLSRLSSTWHKHRTGHSNYNCYFQLPKVVFSVDRPIAGVNGLFGWWLSEYARDFQSPGTASNGRPGTFRRGRRAGRDPRCVPAVEPDTASWRQELSAY